LNEHFTTSVLAQGVFNIMSLRLKNQSLNPQSLYKLEWTMTTKVEILPFNPMDHLSAAKNGELKGQVDYKK
jgi:hypothetical protein